MAQIAPKLKAVESSAPEYPQESTTYKLILLIGLLLCTYQRQDSQLNETLVEAIMASTFNPGSWDF